MLRPNAIYNVDCVEGMSQLATGSVPCVITSPPYDEIRDFEPLPFAKFQEVATELWRILTPGGNVCWVMQDQIYKEGGISGTKYRQAIFFQELGFTIHHDLYLVNKGHRKRSNRYYNQVHLCLCMSKGRPEYIHVIADRPNVEVGKPARYFQRQPDGSIRKWTDKTKFTPEWGYRTNVWQYAAYTGNDRKHIPELSEFPASMQEEMADDLVVAFSRPDWIVLDPFCGAGTTCKMALLRGRRYLGFEIDPQWHALACRRMELAHQIYMANVDESLSIGDVK